MHINYYSLNNTNCSQIILNINNKINAHFNVFIKEKVKIDVREIQVIVY